MLHLTNFDIELLMARKIPASIYLFKVNNRNTKKRNEICSKLIKTPERRHLAGIILLPTSSGATFHLLTTFIYE